jgi:hypothetical protein
MPRWGLAEDWVRKHRGRYFYFEDSCAVLSVTCTGGDVVIALRMSRALVIVLLRTLVVDRSFKLELVLQVMEECALR